MAAANAFSATSIEQPRWIYYDSSPNNNGRPYNEYPDLKSLGEIEIHVPAEKELQAEVECGCMVVLRYWQLFHGKEYNLKGEEA